MIGLWLITIIVLTLIIQALLPTRKMLVILSGATVSTTVAVTLGNQSVKNIYDGIPWDVLVILLGLGIFSSLFAKSRLFNSLAVSCTRVSQGNNLLILITFSSIMFILSCTVNNLTALLLVLPILLTVLKALGATQKFIGICLSMLIVSCNLGGAATPIGDFPAILLMGTGSISFVKYLFLAFPMCILIFVVLLILTSGYYRKKARVTTGKLERSLALASMEKLYRNITIDQTILYPSLGIFCLMFALWIFANKIGLSPGIVCFLGVSLLMIVKNEDAEDILRHGIDFETILFLTALFIMVSCMAGSGMLKFFADRMFNYFKDPTVVVYVLMICCGICTAIFSAGPSMATMLPIAQEVISRGNIPSDIVYVGLALSVCAGSSFLLTAATSGPLSQTMVEKSGLITSDEQTGKFDFMTFLPFGIFAYVVIQLGGLLFVLLGL